MEAIRLETNVNHTFNRIDNMKKQIFQWALFVIGIGVLSSCYYDKEELLYGNTNGGSCDSMAVVSYSSHVVPLFQQYCYSCHTGGSPSGGILMGTHAADRAIAVNGSLYGSISHASGYSPMPEGEPKMQDCKINIIKRWIDDGTPNN